MELASLLGHCAAITHIVKRDSRASDVLVSEYFRSRKYIGSKERKFLSALTYAHLRSVATSEYCVWHTVGAFESAEYRRITECAATLVLAPVLGTFDPAGLIPPNLGLDIEGAPEDFHSSVDKSLDRRCESSHDFQGFSEAILRCFNDLRQWAATTNATVDKSVENSAGFGENRLTSNSLNDLEPFSQVPGNALFSPENRERLEAYTNFPPSVLQSLVARAIVSDRDVFKFAHAFLTSAPLGLRANTTLFDRESLAALLRNSGVEPRMGQYSPHALVLDQRAVLQNTDAYKNGLFEVQDEGSQLIGFAVGAQQGWRVLDACAGAGGKSLHLAQIMADSGTVVASDIDSNRLREAGFRAQRAGLASVETATIDPRRTDSFHKYKKSFDAVLVDAPCSGLGVARRMPMQKWRFSESSQRKMAKRQLGILGAYAQLVRPAGVLVYSTCSLDPTENQEVRAEFLRNHPEFEPEALLPVLEQQGVDTSSLAEDEGQLVLMPHRHGTDGFYIARFRKT